MSRTRPDEVAIVGMGCRFPGAEDLYAFWANVLANRDCTREVPAGRWDLGAFYDPTSRAVRVHGLRMTVVQRRRGLAA